MKCKTLWLVCLSILLLPLALTGPAMAVKPSFAPAATPMATPTGIHFPTLPVFSAPILSFPGSSTFPGPSPTPSPTSVFAPILVASPTLPPKGEALLFPLRLSEGLKIYGAAEPSQPLEFILASIHHTVIHRGGSDRDGSFGALFSPEECALFDGIAGVGLTIRYARFPALAAFLLPIRYQTARIGNAQLIGSVLYSRRNTALRIQGQVNQAGIPLELLNADGTLLQQAYADAQGWFSFLVETAFQTDRPMTTEYRLLLNGDTQRPEMLQIVSVEQETLLPFNRSLQASQVGIVCAALFGLSALLSVACLSSRTRTWRQARSARHPK